VSAKNSLLPKLGSLLRFRHSLADGSSLVLNVSRSHFCVSGESRQNYLESSSILFLRCLAQASAVVCNRKDGRPFWRDHSEMPRDDSDVQKERSREWKGC
jgi:hypothetical protein